MNSADRLELQLIRDDQAQVHRRVRDLDARIDLLARHLEAPSAPPPPPEPPPLPEAPAPTRVPEPPVISPHAGGAVVSEAGVLLPPPVVSPVESAIPAQPAPGPTAAEPDDSLEMRVGTYWMARIGIVILLTGLVFLGNYAYHQIVPHLGPWGKLALLALAGVGLAGVGAWLEQSRESTRNYGRVLLAGGAATLYYTVYAAHFVAALRVIESPIVGGTLLLACAGGFIWFAERRRSEALALPAVLLAYYTSAINAIEGFTLFSNLLLTAVAVFFLVRHRWTRLSVASLVATYGSYVFWRLNHLAETGDATGRFAIGLAFLACYWVVFTAAVFLAAPEAMRGPKRVAFLTANNGAFFALAADYFSRLRPDSFWSFALGYGAVLLGLAALAAKLRSEERALDGAYLAQGFGMVTLGFAAKLTGPQFAVVLAVESAVLLAGSRRRHGWLYELAAGLCALGACGLTLTKLTIHEASPLALGGPVAALLLADAWWVKRLRGEFAVERFSERAFAFAALGLAVVASALWHTVGEPWQPAAFALAACVSLAALCGRLPEIALPGQTFLGAAVACYVARYANERPEIWWNALPVIVAALGLMHWWQRQRTVALSGEGRAVAELACAGAAVATGICALGNFYRFDAWLWATSAAALGTLLYGLITRAWALAVVGQIFTVLAALAFGGDLVFRHPTWAAALAPVINMAVTSLLVTRLAARQFPALPEGFSFVQIAQGYRLTALAMLGAWAWVHVEDRWRVAFFAGLGAAQILFGALSRNRERAAAGGLYAAVGLVLFWLRFNASVTMSDLAAILAIPASLRLGRRLTGEVPLFPEARNVLVGGAMASLWLWVTRATFEHGHAAQLTAVWAVLALVIFAAGLGLRERMYRLGGFAVLGLAVGRLFFVDVWGFDTLYRIVSFLVLGVVLLVLSFVYNRFAETLRRWL